MTGRQSQGCSGRSLRWRTATRSRPRPSRERISGHGPTTLSQIPRTTDTKIDPLTSAGPLHITTPPHILGPKSAQKSVKGGSTRRLPGVHFPAFWPMGRRASHCGVWPGPLGKSALRNSVGHGGPPLFTFFLANFVKGGGGRFWGGFSPSAATRRGGKQGKIFCLAV